MKTWNQELFYLKLYTKLVKLNKIAVLLYLSNLLYLIKDYR